MAKELTKAQEVERSIITKFRKGLWSRFLEAIKTYGLIEEGDKIAVCVSGGKDSFLLAKLVQELKKHSEIRFDAEFISMNPGYNDENAAMKNQYIDEHGTECDATPYERLEQIKVDVLRQWFKEQLCGTL